MRACAFLLSVGMLVVCKGASLETVLPSRSARDNAQAEMLIKNSFLVTGYPPPILSDGDSRNQGSALSYLKRVRKALHKLDPEIVIQLFGDRAYIEPSNCAERMNKFIRCTIYHQKIGLISQDSDLRGEENRVRNRKYHVMIKLHDLIIAVGRDAVT